jgi:hypothetical protein
MYDSSFGGGKKDQSEVVQNDLFENSMRKCCLQKIRMNIYTVHNVVGWNWRKRSTARFATVKLASELDRQYPEGIAN